MVCCWAVRNEAATGAGSTSAKYAPVAWARTALPCRRSRVVIWLSCRAPGRRSRSSAPARRCARRCSRSLPGTQPTTSARRDSAPGRSATQRQRSGTGAPGSQSADRGEQSRLRTRCSGPDPVGEPSPDVGGADEVVAHRRQRDDLDHIAGGRAPMIIARCRCRSRRGRPAIRREHQVTGLQRLACATGVHTLYWSAALCGRLTPAAAQAHMVRPEQSKVFGPPAPHDVRLAELGQREGDRRCRPGLRPSTPDDGRDQGLADRIGDGLA